MNILIKDAKIEKFWLKLTKKFHSVQNEKNRLRKIEIFLFQNKNNRSYVFYGLEI